MNLSYLSTLNLKAFPIQENPETQKQFTLSVLKEIRNDIGVFDKIKSFDGICGACRIIIRKAVKEYMQENLGSCVSEEMFADFNAYLKLESTEGFKVCLVDKVSIPVTRLFGKIAKEWEHFSGIDLYPVPSGLEGIPPGMMFSISDMWEGDYGALRKDLLNFVIGKLQENQMGQTSSVIRFISPSINFNFNTPGISKAMLLEVLLSIKEDIRLESLENSVKRGTGICNRIDHKLSSIIETHYLSINDQDAYSLMHTNNIMKDYTGKEHFLGSITFELKRLFSEVFVKWEKYSGDLNFPVPDPNECKGPYKAFFTYPLWEGEYGDLRKELLDFAIGELEK
ncbi:hypothetical protein TH1_143 [Shewanella phage Thanatos-1]|nr:hypothetical protein TH1_143 [Shewanella phage Thanatos-1]